MFFEVSTLMRATETRKTRLLNAAASEVGMLSGTCLTSECGWRCSILALHPPDGDVSLSVLNFVAMGDVTNGMKLFKAKCATCHTCNEGGPNKQGPNLFGVIGRQSGQVAGFRYTKANQESGIVWTIENMQEYLANPKKFIKGTNMAFPGFKKEKDRADVAAYLKSLG